MVYTLHFQDMMSQLLPDLRSRWLEHDSQASLSVLLQATNLLLRTASSETNKTISLSSKVPPRRSLRIPKDIRKSGNAVAKANRRLKAVMSHDNYSDDELDIARNKLKNLKM